MRQYYDAQEGRKAQLGNIGGGRTKPGTVNALCVAYYRSQDFKALSETTQANRRGILERFRIEHGDKPVRRLERRHIKAIMSAKSETPEAANNLLKVLRVILNFAIEIEMIDHNPGIGVRRFKSRGDGYHTWTEDEIGAFEERHPSGSRARLALALLLHTAQRRSDVVVMGWQHVRGDLIAVRQHKTSTPLLIPMHPALAAELKSSPRTNMTFLLTERGAPFTAAGFGNWFRARCNEAGLVQCSAHGLRKAAARRLAEAGCSADQIKAVTGHKTLSEVARYTKAADQERLARDALRLQIGAERQQELSSPPTRLDKSSSN